MTDVLDATPNARTDEPSPTVRMASWPARAGAFALDVLPGAGVIAVLALLSFTVPQRGWMWWAYAVSAAVVVLLMMANRWLLPAITGWSLGRATARHRGRAA